MKITLLSFVGKTIITTRDKQLIKDVTALAKRHEGTRVFHNNFEV